MSRYLFFLITLCVPFCIQSCSSYPPGVEEVDVEGTTEEETERRAGHSGENPNSDGFLQRPPSKITTVDVEGTIKTPDDDTFYDYDDQDVDNEAEKESDDNMNN